MGRIMQNGIDYTGASVVELTQAEYDALPSSKYSDGITYMIKDRYSANATKMLGVGDCYSTSEKIVGCWTDGKPLYQKTVDCGAFPNTGQKQVPHNIADVDKIWVKEIGGYVTNGAQFFVTNRATSPAQYSWDISASRTHIIVEDYVNFSNDLTTIVTVLYTKTTDVAGSGDWTPSGVPAAHYSTDEQIIGTWVDDKTLYRKVIPFSANIGSSTYSVNVASLSIDKITNIRLLSFENNNEYINVYRFGLGSNNTLININCLISGFTLNGQHYLIVEYTKSS